MVKIENREKEENLKTIGNIVKEADSKKLSEEKILILGLDNSGKTSIVLSLKGNENLLSYYSLKPTKGIEINKTQQEKKNFYVWDFGGQESFRERHLRDFSGKSQGAEKLIYVIDIQDFDKYNDSIKYLKKIVENPEVFELQILVYLHKYDPSIEVDQGHPVHEKIPKLISKIERVLEDHQNFKIFKTSIYTTFRKLQA